MRPYWARQDTLPAALLPPPRQEAHHCPLPGKQVPTDDRWLQKRQKRDFPGGPVVRNPPSNGGDVGSALGWGTKIPRAMGQLSPRVIMKTPQAATKTQCSQINK